MRDPRVGGQVVQRLSETYLIRRAARFTAYVYLRGKQAVEDKVNDKVVQSSVEGISRIKDNFKQELQKGISEAKEEMRRKR